MHVSLFLRCSEQIPGQILLNLSKRGGGGGGGGGKGNVKRRPIRSLVQLVECSHGKRKALGSSPAQAKIFPPL